jgi:hypothetical protein
MVGVTGLPRRAFASATRHGRLYGWVTAFRIRYAAGGD